ncbi:MAG: sirohydrochlorin chelatase [Chloroflexi bacterium]|nr:sirohydrochlorin chelatase [Chloroflexota bacterium]
MKTPPDALLLIGHGSPDPAGNEEFRRFAHTLAVRVNAPVTACYLEKAAPDIATGIQMCVAAGARRVVALPLFLGAAGHQKNDVPALLNEMRARHSNLDIRYGAPIGPQHAIVLALAQRAAEAIAAAPPTVSAPETALLVVGRGSSDPDSNSDVNKIARLLFEGRAYGWVQSAFFAVTRPDVTAGIEQCLRLGARRVVVLPYLLFTGEVRRGIEAQARHTELAKTVAQAGGEVLVAQHLANHEGVVSAVAQRYWEAVSGAANMTCDLCKYRNKVEGFESDYGLPQTQD